MAVSGFGHLGTHDPSACLITDDGIVAAAEEERFTRDKWAADSPDSLPADSIRFVLEYGGYRLSDVDAVAIGWDPGNFSKNTVRRGKKFLQSRLSSPTRIDKHLEDTYSFTKNAIGDLTGLNKSAIREKIRGNLNTIFDSPYFGDVVFVPHHRSHAASAFYCSGYDQQVGITADGGGEHDCTVLWTPELGRLKEYTRPNSIGHFYSWGAEYLGYTEPSGNRHAGKVMGLAPYGNYREEFEKLFNELVETDGWEYDVTEFTGLDIGELEGLFGESHNFPGDFEQHHKDFAYHLQKKTEEIVTSIVKTLTKKTGVHKLSVAGGVFMNCKMNKQIIGLDCVDELFIQPVAKDSGVSLGAALEVYISQNNENPVTDYGDVYFGPEYSNDEVERVLEQYKLTYEKPADITAVTAELLANNQLVGWFQGRMEFGPRALGNRSILANPSTVEMRDAVNKNVKNRAAWRPFAPSLLNEANEEYFERASESPFMILTDDVKEGKHDEVPAIVHVDGTARPQTVRPEQNKRYYTLLKEFRKRTGIPVLLNTSFNKSGEPIVESPIQAIHNFYTTGLDALVIEDFLLRKESVQSGGVQS